MRKTFLVNLAIILTTVLIVVAPVVTAQFSEEIARWHLAAAANAVELGIGDREESLSKAKELSSDIFGLRDYWLLLLQETLDKHPDKLPELVRFAKAKDPNLARLGTLAVSALEAEGQYELAVNVLEESITEEARSQRINLNYLAYMRSLAGVDLEKARKDINQALKHSPNDPALRDTRAWVLFKLGELEAALEDAEFAVSETEKQRLANPFRFLDSWSTGSIQVKQDGPATDSKTTDETTDAKTTDGDSSIQAKRLPAPVIRPAETVSMQTYQEGVMRYHRGRILEKLGRAEQMEQDWQWLRQHKLPIDDSLH